jgi:drug/metabolite transporter (DMT)-like permease
MIPDSDYFILIATLTWAFGSLYTKKKAASFNPYFSLGLQMFISSILLLPIMVQQEHR